MPLIRNVGNYIREQQKNIRALEINKKGVRDFVTEVDMHAERALVEHLHNLFPAAGFITEEKTVSQEQHEYNWIIDPLDGTMNYVHGIPLYSISVALQKDDEPLIGMVYEIVHDEFFFTWKGGQSFCNDDVIRVGETNDLKDALIVTGFPYIRTDERTTALANSIKYFLDRGRDIRRLGTAATDLSYIACGRIDIYYEGFLNTWDIAAGILIVRNAGGTVTNFSNENNFSQGQVVASNPVLHALALPGVDGLKSL